MGAVRDKTAETSLQESARIAQKLARDLRRANSAQEAFDISRDLARVSKQIEEATRAVRESECALREAEEALAAAREAK
jgi:hypothetical protein